MTEQIHPVGCSCWKCYADQMGQWIDTLGPQTAAGRWQDFVTVTYSTPSYPWQRGFPVLPGRPKADFAHHLFDRLISHLEKQLGSRIDYVVADQFGSINGRFHQHAILSGVGLDSYPRKEIWKWLKERAGWSRVLPFLQGASYYISRYIGRDANRCDWFPRVGEEPQTLKTAANIGRTVVVQSADVGRHIFKQGWKQRKR